MRETGAGARRRRATVIVGGIPVEVERGGVRRLNLRVRADGSARLSVPARVPAEDVRRFLAEHEGWLRAHVERRLARRADGAGADGLVALWGRLVELPGGVAPDELWRDELERRLPGVVERMEAATGAHASGWQLRAMSTRWGSCTPRTGRIRVNVRLAAYPPTCLDYVVAHELTHLLEPSHNERFHVLLARAYPDEGLARALLRRDARDLAATGFSRPGNEAETGGR